VTRTTRVLLGLFVFTLPFDQAFALPLVGSLSRAVGLVVALFALVTLLSSDPVRLRKLNLLVITAGIFVGWNFVSTFWAIDRESTISQSFTYIQLWVMVWLFWQFIETSAQAQGLRNAYIWGTWVTLGTITWGYLSNNPTVDPTRFTAFDTNANYTAQSIALAIPMAFDVAVHGRAWRRFLAILLIAASLFGIALTGSRSGGLIAAVAVIGSIFLIIRGRRWMRSILMAMVVLAIGGLALLLPPKTIQRFAGTLTQVESADFSGRGEIWEAGFESWFFRPALGAGSGNFGEAVAPTLGGSRAAHNSFLSLLVELGPIGPTLFLVLFIIAIWPYALTLTGRGGGPQGHAIRYAALAVVLLTVLLLTQLPANWQYQRVTWYILVAATFDSALFFRSNKRGAVEASGQLG